jgi:hypothetical protein
LLSERGMKRDNGVVDVRVCDDCHLYLSGGKTPKHAIANGFYLGEAPFADITPTEYALVRWPITFPFRASVPAFHSDTVARVVVTCS